MAFKTVYTEYGLARLANAEATGVPVNLVDMAIGDGGGAAIDPTALDVLVNEVARYPLNIVEPDLVNPAKFHVEAIVPPDEGGWVIREFSLIDGDGGTVAIGSFPATYKPLPTDDGAVSDLVIQTEIFVANTSVITILLDPNVAVATRQWVINNITAAALIPGGTTGQYLSKSSNLDGAFVWKYLEDTNVFVDMIEEKGTLSDGQKTINMVVCTTLGLAVFIGGGRINRGAGAYEWQPDPDMPDTRIILGRAYGAGTTYLLTQNEPTASLPIPLERSQNLADVPDKALARANLGIQSADETAKFAPPSLVAYFARNTAPSGWLKANGAAVSRTVYANLFAAIGVTFGAGDGLNTFNLPDMRGVFARGWDDGRGVDVSRVFGSIQSSQNLFHSHDGTTNAGGQHNHGGATGGAGGHGHGTTVTQTSGTGDADGGVAPPLTSGREVYGGGNWSAYVQVTPVGDHAHAIGYDGNHAHYFITNGAGGNESRPINVALLACIKI